jgi:hypothetical protein
MNKICNKNIMIGLIIICIILFYYLNFCNEHFKSEINGTKFKYIPNKSIKMQPINKEITNKPEKIKKTKQVHKHYYYNNNDSWYNYLYNPWYDYLYNPLYYNPYYAPSIAPSIANTIPTQIINSQNYDEQSYNEQQNDNKYIDHMKYAFMIQIFIIVILIIGLIILSIKK